MSQTYLDKVQIFNLSEAHKKKEKMSPINTSTISVPECTQNILERANEIIYKRSEEKERKYGPFNEGMERAAKIASGITGKDLTANDMFAALIALKFSRISYTPTHEDSYLDAAAYTAQMFEYNKAKCK